MPSTYAHYRLSKQIRKALTGREKEIVEAYPALFHIGSHGPDILFYYQAWKKTPISQMGHELHKVSGYDFFAKMKKVVEEKGEKEAHLAYVYGVLTHFALDVCCHGYVAEKMAASDISHSEVEVEFDRYLMLQDGYNPVTHSLIDHIEANWKNGAVIKDFYEGTTMQEMTDALHHTRLINKLFICRSWLKRQLLFLVFRAMGSYEGMHGLIVNPKGNPVCKDSNRELRCRYKEAQKLALSYIRKFDTLLEEGNVPETMLCNFESEKVR